MTNRDVVAQHFHPLYFALPLCTPLHLTIWGEKGEGGAMEATRPI